MKDNLEIVKEAKASPDWPEHKRTNSVYAQAVFNLEYAEYQLRHLYSRHPERPSFNDNTITEQLTKPTNG